MGAAFAIAIAIALLLVVLIGLTPWGKIGDQPMDSNIQHATPIGSNQGEAAFVTASVLNCRTAPAMEAESVAVLVRGDPVRLLARDEDWISLVHEDWAMLGSGSLLFRSGSLSSAAANTRRLRLRPLRSLHRGPFAAGEADRIEEHAAHAGADLPAHLGL